MIDMKLFREQQEVMIAAIQKKGVQIDWSHFVDLDKRVLSLKQELESLASQRNELTKQVQVAKSSGGDFQSVVSQVQTLKQSIAEKQAEHDSAHASFMEIYLQIPNAPFEEVPMGKSDEENVDLEFIGEKPSFDFVPKTHWELLEAR